jgi:hypothetical protein
MVERALIGTTEFDIFSIDPATCVENWRRRQNHKLARGLRGYVGVGGGRSSRAATGDEIMTIEPNDAWHRRHAVQVVASLPETTEDALLVLELAKQLVQDFLAEPPPKAGPVIAFRSK